MRAIVQTWKKRKELSSENRQQLERAHVSDHMASTEDKNGTSPFCSRLWSAFTKDSFFGSGNKFFCSSTTV
jgi:hypothetical protein